MNTHIVSEGFHASILYKPKSEAHVQFTVESFKKGFVWWLICAILQFVVGVFVSSGQKDYTRQNNNLRTKRRRGIEYHICCFQTFIDCLLDTHNIA